MDQYIDKQRLNTLLKWYMQEVGDDLVSVLVVGRDGLVVDILTRSGETEQEKRFIGAFSALVEVVLRKITQDFELGTFGAGTFDTDKYRFIFCEAGIDYLLVGIYVATTMLDTVFPHTYLAADKIARIIEGRPASPVIPKLKSGPKFQQLRRLKVATQYSRTHTSEYIYKLCLIGDGGVGKTSMVQVYAYGIFPEDYKATIGTFITKKECKFEELNTSVRLLIWDLAGQAQFERIWPDYLTDANAGIIVYDITNRDSFNSVKKWYDQIISVALPNVILILAGNKVDLEDQRIISTKEGEELAKKLGMYFMETSAKNQINLDEVFENVALELLGDKDDLGKIYRIEEGLDSESDLNLKYEITESQLKEFYNHFSKQLEYAIDKNEVQIYNDLMELLKEIEKNIIK